MVRVLELERSPMSMWLGTGSKLNRDPAFIQELIDHGEARAEEFLTALEFERAWRARDVDAVLGHFADDVELEGRFAQEQLAPFVHRHLAGDVEVDATRKQVARQGVTWSVNVGGGKASAHAELRDGRIMRFRVA
jgi:NTE family protein